MLLACKEAPSASMPESDITELMGQMVQHLCTIDRAMVATIMEVRPPNPDNYPEVDVETFSEIVWRVDRPILGVDSGTWVSTYPYAEMPDGTYLIKTAWTVPEVGMRFLLVHTDPQNDSVWWSSLYNARFIEFDGPIPEVEVWRQLRDEVCAAYDGPSTPPID